MGSCSVQEEDIVLPLAVLSPEVCVSDPKRIFEVAPSPQANDYHVIMDYCVHGPVWPNSISVTG